MSKILSEKEVIVYGAGYCGLLFAELLKKNNYNIKCFFDKNRDIENEMVDNLVIEYPHYSEEIKECIVVVALLRKGTLYTEIKEYLEELGFENICHIYDLWGEELCFHEQRVILCPNKKLILKNLERYKNLYNNLQDAESKNVLISVMSCLLSNPDSDIVAHPMSEKYFAYDVYKNIENEIIVDCGAFKGAELDAFSKMSAFPWKEYYAIEADDAYKKDIIQKSKVYENVSVHCPVACSDEKGIVHLKNYRNMNSVITEGGNKEVVTVTLDEMLCDVVVTMLKMDVEGYELKVLKGAENIIKTNKPVIAVATDHYEEEFFELFEYISSIVNDYHFFLRSYMNWNETVLYAVPDNRLIKAMQ